MEKNNRDLVAARFAENLVGQMLQRCGKEFYHASGSADGAADFVVRNGEDSIAVEVKYADQASEVPRLLKSWQGDIRNMRANAVQSHGKSMLPVQHAVFGACRPAHLVVVTGNGDRVFADRAVAPWLVTDARTTVSLFEAFGTVAPDPAA